MRFLPPSLFKCIKVCGSSVTTANTFTLKNDDFVSGLFLIKGFCDFTENQ